MRIVPFGDWTRLGRWWPTTKRRGIAQAIVVHHAVITHSTDAFADARRVERIIYGRRLKSRFSMIAYSWLIHPDGTIFEARASTWRNGANNNTRRRILSRLPSTKILSNGNTVSVCFIGDFRYDTVTTEARQAFWWLVNDLRRRGVTVETAAIVDHSELAFTECSAGAIHQLSEPAPAPGPSIPDTDDEDDTMPIQYYDPETKDQVVIWLDDEEPRPCYDVLQEKGQIGKPMSNLLALCRLHWIKKG